MLQEGCPATWSEAVADAAARGCHVVPEHSAKQLLASQGVAVPRGVVGLDAQDLLRQADEAALREPFVLKVVSPGLLHKSDVGGVSVGLTRSDLHLELTRMEDRLEAAGFEVAGFLIEEQAASGVEMVVGAVRDSSGRFVVMIGLGGVFIEVMEDVAFRVAPLGRLDIMQMVGELRAKKLLQGFRGEAAYDLESFTDTVYRLAGPGGLLDSLPAEVQEVDLNPMVVHRSGVVALDARFILAQAEYDDGAASRRCQERTDFRPLLAPASVAVLGASSKAANAANLFIRNIKSYGFAGDIYPIHPTAQQIEGIPARNRLSELPTRVDYAFVALPAHSVRGVLAAAPGAVRFAQVISSGFAEVEDGAGLEKDLVDAAAQADVRVLGPNCLGTHSPRGSLTFVENADPTPGAVAVISQSGGLSVDILRIGHERGVRFSGVVSLGNGADVTPAELLKHFLADPETQVIGLYLESLSQANLVLDVMRQECPEKPVVLLAGGRTEGGARAAQSHTGALAGNHRMWPAIADQAGMVLVDSLPELMNALLAFQFRIKGQVRGNADVVLFGNGGGTSVLATDALERAGLSVPVLPERTRRMLLALNLPPGTSFENPLDAPAWTLAVDGGRPAKTILSAVLATTEPALVISHFNVGIIASNTRNAQGDVMSGLISGVAQARDEAPGAYHLLVLRPDGSAATEELITHYREQASTAGLPVFRDLSDAATAGRALVTHDSRRLSNDEL